MKQYYHRSSERSANSTDFAAEYPFGLMHSARLGAMYSLESNEYMLSPEVTFSLADSTSFSVGAQYFSSSPTDLGMPAMGQNKSIDAKLQIGFYIQLSKYKVTGSDPVPCTLAYSTVRFFGWSHR